MKLLVFAHTPPPHHGQSYMVQLLLEQLKSSPIEALHVNARLSGDYVDIGRARWGKVFGVVAYCIQAIWFRLARGVDNFYYVPASGNRAPLYRDWLVMLLCRPFFRRMIYHWHSAGLGEWLEKKGRPWERKMSSCLLYAPDLSIALGKYNCRDAEAVASRKTAIVPNGIPDPRPDFDKDVLPLRIAQAQRRQSREPYTFQVLYLGLCLRQKGLFDLLEAIAIANGSIRETHMRMKAVVAGSFFSPTERKDFDERIARPDLVNWVEYKGFVNGDEKQALLRTSDCMCFPTYYESENFPLVVLEGMAYGLPLVVTNWRGMSEFLPAGYEHIVEPRSPDQLAKTLVALLGQGYDPRLRAHFLENYTEQVFGAKIRAALLNL